MAEKKRCPWCGTDPMYVDYHDTEWGVPEHRDAALFEKLLLDGFQAGLSWIIVLRKRDGMRAAFDRFNAQKIARYDAARLAELATDARIVRNRAKIAASVKNAQAYLDLRDGGQSFDDFLWQFTGGVTLDHRIRSMGQVPTQTAESVAMSKELKRRGFSFVGPTICYAFMQAVGMINDHQVQCFRHAAVGKPAASKKER